MRLIDADTLNFTCTADEDYKCQKIVDCNCCPFHTITSFEIENEPTIQAVPIEEVIKIIEFEEKWLSQTRMSIRDIDIAFNAMKSKIKQIEGE